MSTDLITLVTKRTKMTQAQLALKLGVSTTQISKWKRGEYMPDQRQEQLLEMIGMSSEEVAWMPFVKDSNEIADWVRYFTEMQADMEEFKYFDAFGYIENEQVAHVMERLQEFSIKIPPTPPMEDLEDGELCGFSSLIHEALDRAGRLAYWMQKNIGGVDDVDFYELQANLESHCLELALGYIDTEMYKNFIDDISRFREKRFNAQNEARRYLTSFCDLLKEKGMPIREDYFEILSDPPECFVDEDELYEMPFSNIADYYSHPERKIIEGQRYLCDVLYELHRKIDCLLTEDMKVALDSGITITKPFFPYPPENEPS